MAEGESNGEVIFAREKDLSGLTIRRVLPSVKRRSVGPFVFLDHFGPFQVSDSLKMDVGPHPHIGLETISYLFDGEVLHRDSLGFEQLIQKEALNLMTAGRGIMHSERMTPAFHRSGRTVHGVQVWIALPKELEECEPQFQHFPATTFPERVLEGLTVRTLVGEAFGLRSEVRTGAPALYADLKSDGPAEVELGDWAQERALYIVDGTLSLNGRTHQRGELAILREGDCPLLRASGRSRALLLGGPPLDGPRTMFWNFVATRTELIERAKREYEEGAFGKVVGDPAPRVPMPVR